MNKSELVVLKDRRRGVKCHDFPVSYKYQCYSQTLFVTRWHRESSRATSSDVAARPTTVGNHRRKSCPSKSGGSRIRGAASRVTTKCSKMFVFDPILPPSIVFSDFRLLSVVYQCNIPLSSFTAIFFSTKILSTSNQPCMQILSQKDDSLC